MCIRFSISTKVKVFPFSMALVLSVFCAVIELLSNIENALIIFGFNVSPYKGFIITMFTFFIGFFSTLTLVFITSRIDKKLQFLNKECFLPLLKFFYDNQRSRPEWYIIYLKEARGIKEELVKYGKYFRIPCYPRKLIKEIEEIFEYAKEHNNLLIMVKELSKKKIGKDDLTILFGLLKLSDVNLKNYNQDTVKAYEPVSNYIRQEKTELIEKITTSNKKIRRMQNNIIARFESFLKDNSLEIEDIKPKTNDAISILMR